MLLGWLTWQQLQLTFVENICIMLLVYPQSTKCFGVCTISAAIVKKKKIKTNTPNKWGGAVSSLSPCVKLSPALHVTAVELREKTPPGGETSSTQSLWVVGIRCHREKK